MKNSSRRFPNSINLAATKRASKTTEKSIGFGITAPLFTLFHIASSRSRAVLEELVGPDFKGFIHFDYFSANCSFAWNFDVKAQYCWAHLIRDMRFLLKHPDKKTKAWAEQLLDRAKKMFSAWHRREEMTERFSPFDDYPS